MPSTDPAAPDPARPAARRKRADAQRNVGALLEAAKTVFATAGVDAPAKQITNLAGVGVGTLYRHFPQRSDLIAAVLQREIDACAEAGSSLSSASDPKAALAEWVHRYTEFIGTKRGLATAMHSGDPAFDALPGYFMQRLEPVIASLLEAVAAAGEIRDDVTAKNLLHAVALLCQPVQGEGLQYNQRMVKIYVDGLYHPEGADTRHG